MTSPDPDDYTLLQRIAARDDDALLMLHQRYVHLVYSMARRVLFDGHRAEEVTQDVFVKLWQQGHRYDPRRGRFSSWLLSVTRFAAIDRLRQEGRRPVLAEIRDDGESEHTRNDADLSRLLPTDHAAWERGQHLRLLLDGLPPEQREVIELAYFGGLTHSELAEQLRLPLGTVKGRLRLGLEKLRALWFDERPVPS